MIPPRTDVSLARPKTLCGSGGSGTLRIPRQGVGQFPTLLALGLLIVSSRAAIAEQRTVTLAATCTVKPVLTSSKRRSRRLLASQSHRFVQGKNGSRCVR
jgi:hypothetical protein